MLADHNHLSGSIPPEFGSLVALVTLDVGFNSLTGSLPSSIFSLVTLHDLSLHKMVSVARYPLILDC